MGKEIGIWYTICIMDQRIIAIGDIHGCRESLEALLAKLTILDSDVLVFVGDYVDRGPDTPGTIDTLIQLKKSHPNCVFLRGNHDALLLGMISGDLEQYEPLYLSSSMGGFTTLRQYGCSEEKLDACVQSYFSPKSTLLEYFAALLPPAHKEFLENTQYKYLVDDYLFVHAGINPSKSLAEQSNSELIWIRDEFVNFKHSLPQIIIYGHTPTVRYGLPEPRWDLENRKIGIDTGAIWGGRLTALLLPELEVVSVAGYDGRW